MAVEKSSFVMWHIVEVMMIEFSHEISKSRDYDYIKDLKNDLDIWKIGFGVLDSWIGDRVHAITRYRELEHWKTLIEKNTTYTLYNCHVFDNDIPFNPFKVVFGSGTKVQKYDKLTNVLTREFRFKSFKKIQDGTFKTDVLYASDDRILCKFDNDLKDVFPYVVGI
ncbi:hypothetical protein MTR_0010s0110 [Medicago truncatula]|uniref:Uncharacterized protein n=1 Tax=Medicago truncatula TaxID=3880 RepID=A0A072TJ88_MEDTR|nr:hypothetical protein MTR_0010s0110 [Medicago truncatula]